MITSLRNPQIVEARRLQRRRERRATGRTAIEGPFLLEEALSGGVTVHEIFAIPDDETAARLAEQASLPVTAVSADVLSAVASSVNPRGPVSVISIPESTAIEQVDSLVLWDIADPGNAGTMIRTAAAFGFQVLATADTVDLWSPKVLRSGVGGHFRTNVVEGLSAGLEELVAAGLTPAVAAADGVDVNVASLPDKGPVALIVGNEAHGVPTAISRESGVLNVALPMPGGSESLNAAVSAGILMYLLVAQRTDQ